MRRLSHKFMADLQPGGFLSPLREAIARDRDLLFEIRNKYVSVYFKGQSLVKLGENGHDYSVEINAKFLPAIVSVPRCLRNEGDTRQFVAAMPHIKECILAHRSGKGGNEIEFEQMLIRANNGEPRLNSEYFIIDRQIAAATGDGRFDLMAIYWKREGRRKGQQVPLTLLEVKYGLNPDIRDLHNQLARYYDSLPEQVDQAAMEAEAILHDKLDLGLLHQPPDRAAALRTLTVSPHKKDMRFGIVLVDYNPHSGLLDTQALAQLDFCKRIDVFQVGFGLWYSRAQRLDCLGIK